MKWMPDSQWWPVELQISEPQLKHWDQAHPTPTPQLGLRHIHPRAGQGRRAPSVFNPPKLGKLSKKGVSVVWWFRAHVQSDRVKL